MYIEENVYLNGAKAFCREQNYYCNEWNPKATIISSKEEVFLEITLPEQMFELLNTPINTERLGAPRIVEACYENPDTSPLTICIDLLGKEIKEKANPRKWICVEAENTYVVSKGDLVVLIMSNELAPKIKENFEKLS